MKQSSLPEIPELALRDYGAGAHIDRGWRRLEQELGPAQAQRRSALWWAPALAVVTFGAGLFVGARFMHKETQALPTAEPHSIPTPAAGPVAPPTIPPEARAKPNKAAPPRLTPRLPEVELPEVEEVAPLSVMPEPRDYTPVPVGPPEWEQLANSGDFAAAKSALSGVGGFDAVFRSATPGQLMTLVDIARASGNRDQALRALRRLLEAYPGADEAPLAIWTLANLLDQAGDKAGAAEAYALYRRLSPTGDFAEDAAAREVHLALSQGNVERAAALVEEYARSFPKSRRLGSFRTRLKNLTSPPVAEGTTEKAVSVESDDDAEEGEEPSLLTPAP